MRHSVRAGKESVTSRLKAKLFLIVLCISPLFASPRPAMAACGWHLAAGPSFNTSSSFSNGVAPLSAADVWGAAVGNNAPLLSQTLAPQWNGGRWPNAARSDFGASSIFLGGAATVPASNAWFVENYYNRSLSQTLIEPFYC
ncbi:MAG: hypothetical protein GIW99_12120 [Candidatus Eremiobacteraeota bacterium]|nr:hypothetical protein [Candidatus Eremiobacteraeota bacterium]MBC5828405.1 hypothetical protein [Candidatus Eremiobacteraeota bacterium]